MGPVLDLSLDLRALPRHDTCQVFGVKEYGEEILSLSRLQIASLCQSCRERDTWACQSHLLLFGDSLRPVRCP